MRLLLSRLGFFALFVLVVLAGRRAMAETTPALTLCCSADHELLRIVQASGIDCQRAESFSESVNMATSGSGVLLLADDYPHKRTKVDVAALELSREKNLRLFLEFPDQVPGAVFDPITTTTWERAVITTSAFAPKVQPMQILTVSGARYLPTTSSRTLLSIARVAGYDTALYGLPSSARPLLFEMPEWNALVATTGLSNFVNGRYGPSDAWGAFWKETLSDLAGYSVPDLRWNPSVHPAYGADDKLPVNAELEALQAASNWLVDSRLLVTPERESEIKALLQVNAGDIAIPDDNAPMGDGSLGILEGYVSQIEYDGTQRQRIPLRADCNAESAMLLAINSAVSSNSRHAKVAKNLLSYLYGASGLTGGVRADPQHGAYGLISWGAVSPAWEVANYGDDNARVILGTWAASSLLGSRDWDVPLLRAIAANFRTTGRKGFRGDRVDNPVLTEHGWKHFEAGEAENFAPNFEAWMWNCYLAAYQQTKYKPFLERSREGIHRMMEAYPERWRWQDSNERSRMIFTLAWLIRVDDTPQHREWLEVLSKDLLKSMQPCGAIADRLAGTGGGHYQVPQSNETYGTGESPLIQQNGDPVSDQLYTSGFALLGLHEAAAVTGDAYLKEAEDRLAQYLIRIQVRSKEHPYISGAWLRAFDFEKWDYWGSAGDIGWGPWCAETGWGHTWIGTVMGLREQNETLWDLLAAHDVKGKWKAIEEEMLPDEIFNVEGHDQDISVTSSTVSSTTSSVAQVAYTNPVYSGSMPDPSVIRHEGWYYAYGTGGAHDKDGRIFTILRSRDLVNWEKLGGALVPPSKGSRFNYWAPEVTEHDGKFYLYYSMGQAKKEKFELRVATSDLPEGPFKDVAKLTDCENNRFTIDAFPFEDSDGQWYLFYARNFTEPESGVHPGTALVVDRLLDMTRLAGECQVVVRARYDWTLYEANRRMDAYDATFDWHTMEGPCVVKHDGKYYCFYSGSNYKTTRYGVDYVVADKPMGPYTGQGDHARVLSAIPGKVRGPGHHSIVTGPDNKTDYVVYHAWDPKMKIRWMCVDELKWTPEGPRCEPTVTTQTITLGDE